jgi:hypothetical protein
MSIERGRCYYDQQNQTGPQSCGPYAISNVGKNENTHRYNQSLGFRPSRPAGMGGAVDSGKTKSYRRKKHSYDITGRLIRGGFFSIKNTIKSVLFTIKSVDITLNIGYNMSIERGREIPKVKTKKGVVKMTMEKKINLTINGIEKIGYAVLEADGDMNDYIDIMESLRDEYPMAQITRQELAVRKDAAYDSLEELFEDLQDWDEDDRF